MAFDLEIRNQLPIDTVIIDKPAFDKSIIGLSFNGRAIYSLSLMVVEYMNDNNCSEDEAWEWIDSNTIRSIPHMPNPKPLIIDEIT